MADEIPFVAAVFFKAPSEYSHMRSYWEMVEEEVHPYVYLEGSGYREDSQEGEADIYLYGSSTPEVTYRGIQNPLPLMGTLLRSVTGLGIYIEDDSLNNDN